MAETPVLHLTLGTDIEVNRNWEILDDAMHRLARGTQIPDDVSILGSLDVRDNLTVHGLTTLNNVVANDIQARNLDLLGSATIAGALAVAGPVTFSGLPLLFPDESIDGDTFMKNAPVQTVGVSAAFVGTTALSPTAVEVNRLTLPTNEDVGRWELVLVQATVRITIGAPPASNVSVLELRRGVGAGTVIQSRAFSHSFAGSASVIFDFPVTIVRVTQPTDTSHQWSLWASRTGDAGVTATATFGQIHCIQFR